MAAHQYSPLRDYYYHQRSPSHEEHLPVSPLVATQPANLGGIPSLQSLRSQARNQDVYETNQHQVSPMMSRTPSIASDRYSTVSALTATYFSSNPQKVNPAPAYVAPFGAMQVVTEYRASLRSPSSDDEDVTSRDDVQFTEPALALVNSFLDQLLFSFLNTARSTTLSALKGAVIEVLKARLARETIASAEEELRELLAGGDDDDEEDARPNGSDGGRQWDLELVWKRTRLRVMVYTRLGELEDDDEQRYVKEEELFQGNEKRFSQDSGLVSWAAAIFLTGVLEHLAEQTLQAAGNAAFARVRRHRRLSRAIIPGEAQKGVIVEEHDVEKVALSPTLGRLWRTWRKMQRSSAASSAPVQRSGLGRLSQETLGGQSAVGTLAEGSEHGDLARPMTLEDVPEMEYPEHVLASNIPLPLQDQKRDVDEIEVPGLARDPDEHESDQEGESTPFARRNSFGGRKSIPSTGGTRTSDGSIPDELSSGVPRPAMTRQRSSSVPATVHKPARPAHTAPQTAPESVKEPSAAGEIVDTQSGATNDDAKGSQRLQKNAAAREEIESGNPDGVTGAIVGASAAAAIGAAAVAGSGAGRARLVDAPDSAADPGAAVDASRVQQLDEGKFGPEVNNSAAVYAWDGHKSLIDMKALLASGAVVKRDGERDHALSNGVRTSSESAQSYSLGHRDGQTVPTRSPAKPHHLRLSQTTPANDVENKPTPSTAGADVDQQHARDMPRARPAQLHLPGTPTRRSHEHETRLSDSPRMSESPGRSILASSGPSDERRIPSQPLTIDTRPLPPKQPTKRRSIPGVAFTSAAISPALERNPHRKSWSAAIQQQREQQQGRARPLSVSAVPSVPALQKTVPGESVVQEHPVVQRMASLKRNERVSDSSNSEATALTSASIRGPEDFDMFVQVAETVKYTLTPETVRDTPVQAVQKQQPPVELSSAPSLSEKRQSGVASSDFSDGRPGRSSISKQATSASGFDEDEAESKARKKAKRRSLSRPVPQNTSASSRSGLMAREPRVMTESTQDFADFIRSTGPHKEREVLPILGSPNMSSPSLQSLRSAHINSSSRASSVASRDRARSMTRADIEDENVPPVPPVPAGGRRGKTGLQPRGPTSAANGSSELIDFIRTGPGEHRVPQSVAPFTALPAMDSKRTTNSQMNGGRPPGLKLNTNVSPSNATLRPKSSRSARSLANRAAAQQQLEGTASSTSNAVHPAHSGEPQRLSAPSTPVNKSPSTRSPATETALPGRRRYRNKDPYAIDMDDEDNDLLTALPKNKKQEESLIDFLNNNEPPPDNAPRPLVNANPQPRPLMNRSRVGSVSSMRSAANSEGRPVSRRAVATPTSRTGSSAGPRPKMEARSPGDAKRDRDRSGFGTFSKESNTKDLADFLRNSGPDDLRSAPAPSVGRLSKLTPKKAVKAQKKVDQNKEGVRRSFFGRTIGKKGWLDMA